MALPLGPFSEEKVSKRRRKGKAGSKNPPSTERKSVKSESDHSPLEEANDHVVNPKKVKAEAPPTSSESEEEKSQESDQVVTDEKLAIEFERLKASVTPKERPPAVSVKTVVQQRLRRQVINLSMLAVTTDPTIRVLHTLNSSTQCGNPQFRRCSTCFPRASRSSH